MVSQCMLTAAIAVSKNMHVLDNNRSLVLVRSND